MKGLRYFLIFLLIVLVVGGVAYLLQVPAAIAPFVNALLMMAIPVVLGVYLARRYGVSWRLYGLGALTFIASQVLHIPFNNAGMLPFLARFGIDNDASGWQLVVLLLAVGLSSGLFEETFRYIVYRRWAQDARSWSTGLMFGAGHGGIEAIALGALAMANLLALLPYRGGVPADIGGPEVQALVASFWAQPWYDFLLGTVERLTALSAHLAMSLLVLMAVKKRNLLWLGASILWHALLNAGILLVLAVSNAYLAEGVGLLFAAASIGFVLLLREPLAEEPDNSGENGLQPPVVPEIPAAKVEVTPENLERSRYD